MKKWEYKTVFYKYGIGKSVQNHDDDLNELGRGGWEMVNASPYMLNGTQMGMTYFMKREI